MAVETQKYLLARLDMNLAMHTTISVRSVYATQDQTQRVRKQVAAHLQMLNRTHII